MGCETPLVYEGLFRFRNKPHRRHSLTSLRVFSLYININKSFAAAKLH